MKVSIIGAGSSYTPELVSGFLERAPTLPLAELWLMDISPGRLDVVGGLARRMVTAGGEPFEVHATLDRRQALRESSYVITQLRVGGLAARRADEYLARRHGLIGQETTGVGGMAKALRTVPVLLDIAQDIGDLAPAALLINFANPAGLVTEALSRYAPAVSSVGVCNVPLTAKMDLLHALEQRWGIEIEPERAQLDTLGLNHLSWHRGLTIDAQSVWSQVLETYLERLRSDEDPEWSPHTIEMLGMIPNYYLHYYYHTARKLAAQAKWPPSRAEEVMAVEETLLGLYAEPDRSQPPEELAQRGGAYYSTVATQLLSSHHNDLGETHVVNVRHGGAVPGWPSDWVLEMPCRVSRAGIEPIPVEPLPLVCAGLVAQVKAFELLTVEAAVYGDRRAAYQALLAHPLGPAADRAQAVLDDLMDTHRALLPRFWT